MIPVVPQPEPADFDTLVKTPGQNWLSNRFIELSIPSGGPLPPRFKWKNYEYWTKILNQAHALYGGLCAYLACYIELSTGEMTIDHFENKKHRPDLAYEWSNYRLASHGRNRLKKAKVLDPFLIQDGWFHLELATGSIFPNPTLDQSIIRQVAFAIKHLKLDEPRCRKDRLKYFDDYLNRDISLAYLQRMNPFVHAEAARQGLL